MWVWILQNANPNSYDYHTKKSFIKFNLQNGIRWLEVKSNQHNQSFSLKLQKCTKSSLTHTHRGPLLLERFLLQHQRHTPWTPQWWYSPPQCWAQLSPPVAHDIPQRWWGSFSRWRPPTCPRTNTQRSWDCTPLRLTLSLSLTQKHFLWLILHLYSLLLKTSHASLKTKLWFPLALKISKHGLLALMTAICMLHIWSQLPTTSTNIWSQWMHQKYLTKDEETENAVLQSETHAMHQHTAVWLQGQGSKEKRGLQEKERQLKRLSLNICYFCDLSGSLREMCNERFIESSLVGVWGHPQRPAVAIGIVYPWQQRQKEGKQDQHRWIG